MTGQQAVRWVPLDDRAMVRISGEGVREFLQGLVSGDVRNVTADAASLSALLSPQGKLLFDFFMVADGDDILFDTEEAHAAALVKRLSMYRLRAPITIAVDANLHVVALLGDGAKTTAESADFAEVQVCSDGRHASMGARLIGSADALTVARSALGEAEATLEDYHAHRLSLGIPEGSHDATARTILLENGYDKLGGVSFTKGCYIGQEVTARSHYRGVLRKQLHRILAVDAGAMLPVFGTEVMAGDVTVGDVRSSVGGVGLAMIRSDKLENAGADAPLMAGDVAVRVEVPFWHGE